MPVLIAYATRSGSTREIAQRMGEMLAERGIQADVLDVKTVRNVKGYSAVIVGSAIRMGKPMGEAQRFVNRQREALAGLPLAYFSVSLAAREDTEEMRTQTEAYLMPLKALATPMATADFAGSLDLNTVGPLLRFFFTKAGDEMPQGDFRNWEAIETWTAGLADQLA